MATRFAQHLIRVARDGDTQARVQLGKLYLYGGEGLAANDKAALHWLAQAAADGHDEASALVAACVARGSAGAEIEDFKQVCRRAADQGDPAGYCALGDIYASASDQAQDLEKARAAYSQAAQQGHIGAATKLGLLLAGDAGRTRTDAGNEAAYWLELAAQAGDDDAVRGLGKLLWRQGDREAVRWLEPEARRGDVESMYCLGEILARQPERSVARQGAYWLERATRQDHPQALWLYGRMHMRQFREVDLGLPHSPLQATRLLERAAAMGISQALWDLARIHEMPRHSRRDAGLARRYLEEAASAGVVEAQLELGRRLMRYKNDRAAILAAGRWLSQACDSGSREASELIARIADSAPSWPEPELRRQEQALERIRDAQPVLAARLELAARFGLSLRETLFVQPTDIDRGWCIEIDLAPAFRRKSRRRIRIENTEQQIALERARQSFLAPGSASLDLAATRSATRTRQFKAACAKQGVRPALFVHELSAN